MVLLSLQPSDGGYIYISNSEQSVEPVNGTGGVYALVFDSKGEIRDYHTAPHEYYEKLQWWSDTMEHLDFLRRSSGRTVLASTPSWSKGASRSHRLARQRAAILKPLHMIFETHYNHASLSLRTTSEGPCVDGAPIATC